MRVAALYDIHGNLPALEAVLAEIQRVGVDRIVIGGDVVPGPLPAESLEALQRLQIPVQALRGNGENDLLAQRAGRPIDRVPEPFRDTLRWVGEDLSSDQIGLLESWEESIRLGIPGLGRVLFCHATPRSDAEIFTRITPEDRLVPVFEGAEADLVICGHTHMQFDRQVGDVRVVNAGSVGMPFGEPGAYWLLLGPKIELRRTAYDLPAAAERVLASEYPQSRGFAQDYVLAPPTEAKMLDLFEASALK